MHDDDYDEDGGCLGEDDDFGEHEELLNEKLVKAKELLDEREIVESRDLLNDVINHGNEDQEARAVAMVEELDVIVAEIQAEKEAEVAADDGQESSEERV